MKSDMIKRIENDYSLNKKPKSKFAKRATTGLLIASVLYFGAHTVYFAEGALNRVGSRENQRMAKAMNVPVTELSRLETDLLGAYSLVRDQVKEMQKNNSN